MLKKEFIKGVIKGKPDTGVTCGIRLSCFNRCSFQIIVTDARSGGMRTANAINLVFVRNSSQRQGLTSKLLQLFYLVLTAATTNRIQTTICLALFSALIYLMK